MKRTTLSLILLIVIWYSNLGQNLVPNAGFELFETKRDDKGEAYLDRKGWESPSKGTPDLIITNPLDKNSRIPASFSGRAYYAMVLRLQFEKEVKYNSREYIQCQLIRPLKKGQLYCGGFFVRAAPSSLYAVDKVGMAFTSEKIDSMDFIGNFDLHPMIQNTEWNILTNRDSWYRVSGVFEATGNERYLILGNFSDNKNTNWVRFNPKSITDNINEMAYYHFDELTLFEIESIDQCYIPEIEIDLQLYRDDEFDTTSFEIPEPEIELNFPLVHFNFDSYEPIDIKPLLEYLAQHEELLKKQYYTVHVKGFTDSVGSKSYNMQLSVKRAWSVKNILIRAGLNAECIEFNGFSELNPIADNESEEGRALNRRVEIEFIYLHTGAENK